MIEVLGVVVVIRVPLIIRNRPAGIDRTGSDSDKARPLIGIPIKGVVGVRYLGAGRCLC